MRRRRRQTTTTAPPPATSGQAHRGHGQLPAGDGKGGVRLQKIGDFDQPVYVTQPPGDDQDLFVVEQTGAGPGGARRRARCPSRSSTSATRSRARGEQGLLSIAFAPDYPKSGLLLRRLHRHRRRHAGGRVPPLASDPLVADPQSARVVLGVDQPYAEPQRRPASCSGPTGPAVHRPRRRRLGGRPGAQRPGPLHAARQDPAHRPAPLGRKRPTRSPTTTRSSAGRAPGPRSTPTGCATRGASPSIAATGGAGDRRRGPGRVRGGRPRRPRARARARTSAGRPTRDSTASTTTRAPRTRSRRCSRLQPRRRLLDHRRLRRPRPRPALALRPLPLRRLLRRSAAQLHAAPGRRATDDRALGVQVPSLSSFGEDDAGHIYATSLAGPVYRLCSAALADRSADRYACPCAAGGIAGAGLLPSARSPLWRASRRCCPRQATRPRRRGPSSADRRRARRGRASTRSAASPRRPTSPTLPGAPSFLYVVEQGGTVRVVDHGNVQGQPLPRHPGRVSSGGERGLLSIAFDPHYARNHLFYAYYTNGAGQHRDRRVPRRVQHPGAGELAPQGDRDPAPWRRRTTTAASSSSAPTGDLYAGTGDGGGARRPARERPEQAQAARQAPADRPPQARHASPTRVPRATRSSARPAGTRSTRSACATRSGSRSTGSRIAIGDVGQDRWEEVDYEGRQRLRGANFGWDHFEGDHRFNYPGDNEAPRPKHRYRPPIFEYKHTASNCASAGGCAIIGGYVVRNPELRSLRGRYLYADVYKGQLRSFIPRRHRGRRDRALGVHVDHPSSFGKGAHGRIYVASLDGPVYRLVHTSRRRSPASSASAARRPGAGSRVRVRWRAPPPARPQPSPDRATEPRPAESFEVRRPADGSLIREPRDRLARSASPRWSPGSARRSRSGRRSASPAAAAGSTACATG